MVDHKQLIPLNKKGPWYATLAFYEYMNIFMNVLFNIASGSEANITTPCEM